MQYIVTGGRFRCRYCHHRYEVPSRDVIRECLMRVDPVQLDRAQALREADPKLRRHFGVVMERIGRELRGVPCLPLKSASPPRKQTSAPPKTSAN